VHYLRPLKRTLFLDYGLSFHLFVYLPAWVPSIPSVRTCLIRFRIIHSFIDSLLLDLPVAYCKCVSVCVYKQKRRRRRRRRRVNVTYRSLLCCIGAGGGDIHVSFAYFQRTVS